MLPDDDITAEALRKHFEVLADALATPGRNARVCPMCNKGMVRAGRSYEVCADCGGNGRVTVDTPAPSMPLHAPDWLWEEMEQRELEWMAIEQTFAEIRNLPDTEPGQCPAEEEFVWTREEIDRDRDFEAAGWDEDGDA